MHGQHILLVGSEDPTCQAFSPVGRTRHGQHALLVRSEDPTCRTCAAHLELLWTLAISEADILLAICWLLYPKRSAGVNNNGTLTRDLVSLDCSSSDGFI